MAFLLGGSLNLLLAGITEGQTAGTVREDAFRAQWADYQVDLPQTETGTLSGTATMQSGLMGVFGKSLDQRFPGPFQVRANVATGWEYSDEITLRPNQTHRSYDSPFSSVSFGLFYNRDFGPVTLSARYSAGYTYYFDQNYVGSSASGGIFSQTVGLNLDAEGSRNSFHSSSSASYGNGDDIESGQLRNRFAIGQNFSDAYQLTDSTILGGSGAINYTTYSGGTVASTNTLSDSATLYAAYIVTGKTRLRWELGAGEDEQGSSNRAYLQTLLAVNWLLTSKLTIDTGFGWGEQRDSGIVEEKNNGSHPVYTFTLKYAATEKTSGSFHVGYEGVDVAPDLSIQLQWQPRDTATLRVSVYQSSNFSTYLQAQSLVTRGALISAQQRLFERVTLELSGGIEQSLGYASPGSSQTSIYTKPYYFGNVSLLWPINSWLSFQTYYRGYTGQPGAMISSNEGLQSRASVSFRVTF